MPFPLALSILSFQPPKAWKAGILSILLGIGSSQHRTAPGTSQLFNNYFLNEKSKKISLNTGHILEERYQISYSKEKKKKRTTNSLKSVEMWIESHLFFLEMFFSTQESKTAIKERGCFQMPEPICATWEFERGEKTKPSFGLLNCLYELGVVYLPYNLSPSCPYKTFLCSSNHFVGGYTLPRF